MTSKEGYSVNIRTGIESAKDNRNVRELLTIYTSFYAIHVIRFPIPAQKSSAHH